MADAIFKFDLSSNPSRVRGITCAKLAGDVREQFQEWLIDRPKIIGRDLVVISTEFDRREDGK